LEKRLLFPLIIKER